MHGGIVAGLLGAQRCAGCRRRAGALCTTCRATLTWPREEARVRGVDRVVIPWAYEGVARALVLRLKLRGCAASADAIAAELAVAARETGLVGSVVAWVPGRPRESARRGLDHAEAIARRTAYRLGLPAVPLIQRRADTVDQTHLNARERRSNLTGAFSARPCKCHVVLVDDLVTTGATAEACAAALRAAGASGVELLAACRA